MEVENTSWNILYRGSLDSCNYDCPYCPFAKKKNTRQELQYDQECLDRFTNWVASRNETIHILLTPWGEGLIRKYYQKAMIDLSHMSTVAKIAIQTNLSCSLDWIHQVNKKTFALWVTYHPNEVDFEVFVRKCNFLIANDIQFSIGIVGVKEHFEAIERLKEEIKDRYIWINAYKREENYYTEYEKAWLTNVDSLFPYNNTVYNTKGKKCNAGHTSFSIDGNGDMYPCHFIKNKLGNIYTDDVKILLQPKQCINTECRCYIGYINLQELDLENIYGNQILERIPLTIK
ncbi:STM4011 family radical SAM protein [Aquimarina longa]|uniref:STM4011 family radical SAM protein n=1 Tax=Aquimarina longa TaxID=1080221 RepID=UPI0007851739|nr:STM4011 family radical SAM protein [Aquimarina longa]